MGNKGPNHIGLARQIMPGIGFMQARHKRIGHIDKYICRNTHKINGVGRLPTPDRVQ